MHRIGEHRIWFLVLVAAAYLVGAGAAALVSELSWGPRVPRDLEDYFRDLQTLNLTILGVQASFIGFVFPIVIALAESLSSGRIGLSGRIGIFLKETEANGTAFSSVMLIVAILGQSLWVAQLPDRVVAAITFGNIVWAVINLALILRFITEAIRYLQPGNRRRMINRYVANSAMPELLTSMEMRAAFDRLAASLPGDLDDEFSIYDLGHAENAKKVRADNIVDAFVQDVRPRRLRRALKQLNECARAGEDTPQFRCSFSVAPGNTLRPRAMVATLLPDAVVSPELERLLLRSFNLLDINDQPPDELEHILVEHASDLLQLMKQDQFGQFEAAANEAIDLLVFALAIADSHSFDADFRKGWLSSRKQWLSWMLVLRQFNLDVARNARQRPAYFEHAVYMGYRFQTGIPDTLLSGAYGDSLWLSSDLAHHLCRDIRRAVEDGALQPNANSGSLPNLWATFIGSWEAQANLWHEHSRRSNLDLSTTFTGYREHFEKSAILCAVGGQSGHVDTARWLTDQLIKWRETVRDFNSDQSDYLVASPSTLNIADAVADIESVRVAHSLRDDRQVSDAAILRVALSNYANDGRTVLLLSALRELKKAALPDSLIALARDLLSGATIDDGGNGHDGRSHKPTADWFASALRMEVSWEHKPGSYNALMSGLSARLVALGEPPRVSMRGYSSFGSDGIASFGVEQAEMMLAAAALTGSARLNSIEVADLIAGADDQASRDGLIDRLKRLSGNISELDLAISPVHSLVPKNVSKYRLTVLRAQLVEEISRLAEQVNAASDDAFDVAEFDAQKISKIARWSGSRLLPKHASQFPLPLFNSGQLISDTSDEDFRDYTLNMNGLDFGSLSDPQLSADAHNEEDWWSGSLPEYLSRVVLGDVYRALDFHEAKLEVPDELWETIAKFAMANDRATSEYVLTTPGRGAPRWLSEWAWKEDIRPTDVEFSRHDDQPRGYNQHINDLPIFAGFAPAGTMRLIDLRSFQSLDFYEFDTGAVSISPARDEHDARKANLALLSRRKVTVEDFPGLEIQFVETP